MNPNKLNDLEKCIELLQAGIPVEDCIKKYPELTNEIKELLKTAAEVGNLKADQIPAEGINRSRVELLSKAKQLVSEEEHSGWESVFQRAVRNTRRAFYSVFSPRPFVGRLIMALMITSVLILFSRSLVITSAKSLPGDSLYPIKRVVEDITVYLVPNREIRQEYEVNYSQQRVEEVNNLIALHRIQQISFEGVLESKVDSTWIVSGVTIRLQTGTMIVGGSAEGGSFDLGAVVEVEGVTNSQGSVSANEIHLRKYQFKGLVQAINPSQWQISGVQLAITSKTQIDDDIRIGDYVTVLVRSEDNGLYALAILLEEHPTAIPLIQPFYTETPKLDEDPGAGTGEEYQINGTLDEIGDSYWVVGGQIIYIGGDQENSNDYKIGDYITVKYRIEANGSWTAEEVERDSVDNQTEDMEKQNTPESELGNENEGTSITEPTTDGEKEETQVPPESHETPEPTEGTQESP